MVSLLLVPAPVFMGGVGGYLLHKRGGRAETILIINLLSLFKLPGNEQLNPGRDDGGSGRAGGRGFVDAALASAIPAGIGSRCRGWRGSREEEEGVRAAVSEG